MNRTERKRVVVLCGFVLGAALISASPMLAQQEAPASASGRLPLERVVQMLQDRNAQRAAALREYESNRIYRMQYRGFPKDHDAEMVVAMSYRAPNDKQFKIVSQSGSKFVIEHVLKKLLEAEQEAANDENRRRTALSTENYDFAMEGYESSPGGGQYVLDLLPKTKNKFLYRGKIWVDANDFAVARIEGTPGKNPSLWIKKTEIAHRYAKIANFWLPVENHTESQIRLGGRALLSIEYRDYRVKDSGPISTEQAASRRAEAEIHPGQNER